MHEQPDTHTSYTPVGIVARTKYFIHKHERVISITALLAGFLLDSLTLTRIDRLYDNIVVGTYITISLFGIFIVNLYEHSTFKVKLFDFFHSIFPIIIQFAFGGLFSAFTVFYGRSSSISGSWPFLFILVGLLVGNEFLKRHYRVFTLQVSLLFFIIYSYSIFVVPILVHKMNGWVFTLSGFLSLVIIFLYIRLFRRFIPQLYMRSKIALRLSIVAILVFINILYIYNFIPPIPLSIKDTGIYHSIIKTADGTYLAEKEKQPWYHFLMSDRLHIQAGDSLYAFSSIYTPIHSDIVIVHKWQQWDDALNEWVTKSKIPFSITSGRIDGFRGYSIKGNITTGLWRISIENERGQVIGREVFVVKENDDTKRIIQQVNL